MKLSMKMKIWLTTFLFLVSACGAASGPADDLSKKDAQSLLSDPDDADEHQNICADNGWIGDGECDDWCPGGDPKDCSDASACTDGDTKNADDGCNTCTCTDGGWACTEIACNPGDGGDGNEPDDKVDGHNPDEVLPIEIGDCGQASDAFDIHGLKIKNDSLIVDAGWSGGCAEHTFTACWEGSFMESYPVQARLKVIHNANGDLCEAYARDTLEIDLTAMKDAYQGGYQTTDGTIILHVGGENVDGESIHYVF